jgi:hypothetical protein
MATSAGGVTTEVNLVTSGFEEGVNKIVGLVGTINGALAKIGEVAIGASLGSAITKIVQDIEKIPEAVISSATKMESSAASMASAMEIAAKKSADSWEKAGAEMAASVQKAQQSVDRSARDMAYSLEAATAKAAEFAAQMEKAGETASRGFTANNQQLTRSMEDVSTRGGQAAEDLSRNISRAGEDFGRRMTNIDAEASQRVGNIMGTFNDASGERTRVFNQSLGNIEFGLNESGIRIANSETAITSKLGDQIASIRDSTAERIGSINESFNKTAANIGRQMDAENEKFTQGLELRQATYQDSTSKLALQHQDTVDDLSHKWELLTKHSADAAEKITRQVADQMSALRDAEEAANKEFSRKMSDLAEETLIGPKTQEQQNQLAKKRVQLGADLAQNQEAIDKRKAQISKQANEEREDLRKQTEEAQQELQRRQQKEEELYNRRLEFIDAQYARENLKAQENHDRAMEALSARLAAEEKARDQAVAKAEAAGEKAEAAAKKQAAAQIAALGEQRAAEERSAEHQRQNLAANYEAQQRLAANQLARQLADVKENAERQREAAKVQYERQVEDANRSFDRITQALGTQTTRAQEDWATANDNIQRKWDETNASIKNASEKAATQAAIEYERLGDRFNESVNKMTLAIDEFESTHSNKAAQVAHMFSEAWVGAFNEVQAAAGRATQLEFIDPSDPDKFQKSANQLIGVAKEMSVAMGKDANDVAESMAALSLSNLDPLQHNILQTTAAMSTLPQVTRGMTQVVNAFGALATGQLGEANQRFREFGVNLKEVPGLVFDANGRIVANSQQTADALAKALGRTTEQILKDFPDASQRVLQLVEIYFGDQYKGVLERWLKTTAGQFAQAKAIYENFKLTIGESLNNAIRGPLTEFVTFLKGSQDEINRIGTQIGQELGNFVTGVFNALRRLGEADIVQGAQALLTSLGNLKDQIINTVTGIGAALTAGGQGDFGAAIAEGLTNFAGLIDKVTAQLAQTNVADVAKKISDAFTGIGKSFEDNAGRYDEAFGTLGRVIGETANFLVTNGPEIINMISGIINAATELVKFVLEHGDQVKFFGELFLGFKIGGDIAKIILDVSKGISKLGASFEGLIKVAGKLGPVLGPIGDALGTAILAVLPRILPLLGGFATAIATVVSAMGPLEIILAAVGTAFAVAFVLKITTGIDVLTPLWDKFGESIQKIITLLGTLGAIVGLAGGNPIGAIFTVLANTLPGASETISKGADEIKAKILALFGIKVPENQGAELGASMATAMDGAKARVVVALNGLRDALTERLGNLAKEGEITESLKQVGSEVASAIESGVSEAQFAGLKRKLTTNLQTALAALENIPGEESAKLQDHIRQMLDEAAGAATPEDLKPVLDAVQNGLKPIADAGAEPVKALIAQIDDTLANGENITTERVQAIVDAANAEIEKLPDQGKTSADLWVQNLIESTSNLKKVNDQVQENIGGIGDTVQGSMDTAQSAVETATSAIGNAFSEFGDNANKALDSAKSGVDTFVTDATSSIDGLKTTVSESGIWQGFSAQLDAATTSAQYLGGEFLEFEGILARIGGKGLGAAASNIQKSVDDIKNTVSDAATDVGTAFDQIGTELSTSEAASGMATLEANWNASLENIKKTTQDAATDVGTAFDQIGTELSTSGAASGIATLGDNWNTSIENIKATTQAAVIDIGTAFDQIGTELSTSGLAAALAQGGENLKTSWTNIQGTFQEVADSIPVTLASAGEGIQSSLNSFTGFIAGWISNIPGVLGGLQDILLQALVQPWINIYFNIKNALLEISGASLIDDWFADLAVNMPKWMTEAIQATIDAVNTTFQEWNSAISGSLDTIKNVINEAAEYLKTAFAGVPESLTDILNQIILVIKKPFEDLRDTGFKEILDAVTHGVTEWADGLLGVLRSTLSPENISKIISDAFSGIKDKVMGFLHELHGSGEVEPWLSSLHDTMVTGLEQTVTDSTEAFSGIADAVGDELSAASEEVTTFVSSLGEATNEINKDMSNIIAAAKSGSAGVDRFASQRLAFGDTGPGGGLSASIDGAGGGEGFDAISKKLDQQEADMYGLHNDLARMNDPTGKIGRKLDQGSEDRDKYGFLTPAAEQRAAEAELRKRGVLGVLPDKTSNAMQEANKRVEDAAKEVGKAGKSAEDAAKASNEMQRKNFQDLMKGISSGQSAWTDAAKSTAISANAWSGAAKDVTKTVKEVATTGGGAQPTPAAPATPTVEDGIAIKKAAEAALGLRTDFSVNVSTINIENGDAVDFMQTYVDQYASLLNAGASL